jgi:chromatin assembly factor 1 subunit A
MPPPPAPTNAFEALGGGASNTAANSAPTKIARNEDMNAFKEAIINNNRLSKVGLIDVIAHKFEHLTRAEVKNTIEMVSERTGTGRSKVWTLKPGFEL